MITLTIASGTGIRGGTISLNVSIASTGGDQCTALQFNLNLTADVTLASVALGASAIAASKPLNQAGNLISIGGFNNNVIGDGVIITLTLNIAALPSTGSIPVGITGIISVNASATVLSSTSSTGTITIDLPIVSCPVAGGTAIVGTAYMKTLVVSGGTPPYTYSVS